MGVPSADTVSRMPRRHGRPQVGGTALAACSILALIVAVQLIS